MASYHHLFNVEGRLKNLQSTVMVHHLHEFKVEYEKSISHEHSLLEFSLRGAYIPRRSARPSLYEMIGDLKNLEFKHPEKLVWLMEQEHHGKSRTVPTEIGDLEWWDLR